MSLGKNYTLVCDLNAFVLASMMWYRYRFWLRLRCASRSSPSAMRSFGANFITHLHEIAVIVMSENQVEQTGSSLEIAEARK